MYCTATQFAVSDSSTAISRLNTGRIILDSRWSLTLLNGSTVRDMLTVLKNGTDCDDSSMEFDIVDMEMGKLPWSGADGIRQDWT